MRPFIVAASALALFSGACTVSDSGSGSLSLGSDSPGSLGQARFHYSASDCAFGCSVGRPVLQGSMITIIASVDRAPADLSATLLGPSIGRISNQSPDCNVDAKRCTLDVDIEATAAGDARLELSKDRADFDWIPIQVRPASRIDVSVSATPTSDGGPSRDVALGADGAYEVKEGEHVQLTARVFTSDQQETIFTKHGVSHAYGDTSILAVDDGVLFGATDTEYVKTVHPGETTITVRATGAETVAKFRVTP
jgi:hypothetical protein